MWNVGPRTGIARSAPTGRRAAGTGRVHRGRRGAGWPARRWRRRPPVGCSAGRSDRRPGRTRRQRQDRRRADAQHPTQRAQDAAGLRRGGDQRGHLGIGQQVLQLRGTAHCLRHQPQQPGGPPRQRPRGPRPRRGRAGGARAAAGWAQRAGFVAGGEGGEADTQAAQPPPDQDDHRPGEPPAGEARGDRPAQQIDDAGEACRRGAREGGHERKENTFAPAWASGILRPGFCARPGRSVPWPCPPEVAKLRPGSPRLISRRKVHQ